MQFHAPAQLAVKQGKHRSAGMVNSLNEQTRRALGEKPQPKPLSKLPPIEQTQEFAEPYRQRA